MNTFRAILLPCAGTAGGASPQARAAGQSIIVCGDLSARRPGRATRKQPLPAERQRLGAISDFFFLTCVVWSAANTTRHREPVTDRIRVRRGPAFGGIWKNVRTFRLLNPARISFLGSARVQAGKQTSRCIADFLHNQAPSAGELHEHLATGASACLTRDGSNPTRNGASV